MSTCSSLNDKTITDKELGENSKEGKASQKSGHWNEAEHKMYLLFFQQNINHTKGQRLFKRLSQQIGTRTPSQCRSHHQKFNPLKPKQKPKPKVWFRSKTLIRKHFAKLRKQAQRENFGWEG